MPTPTIEYSFARTTRRPKPRRLLRTSDGDTPVIEQPIRMVSCDTPEKADYAGGPAKSQPKLNECRNRLDGGYYPEIPDALKAHLMGKLEANAAERHIAAANRASREFDAILERRLAMEDGSVRRIAVIPTGQILDDYSRLLAYVAPWYKGTVDDPLTVRSTDPAQELTGFVQFYLHPTFPHSKPIVRVQGAKAQLTLLAWGAFTVGALADRGGTRLELDLSKQADAPADFRER